jgi:hypothetical protein
MSINRVIVNSSPLIVLFKSQQSDLLPQLESQSLEQIAIILLHLDFREV